MRSEIENLAHQLIPLLPQLGVLFIMAMGLALILQQKGLAAKLGITGVGFVIAGAMGPEALAAILDFFGGLPVWLLVLVAGLLLLSLLGSFAAIFIGKEAAAAMVGNLAASLVRALAFMFLWPIKQLRKVFRYFDT